MGQMLNVLVEAEPPGRSWGGIPVRRFMTADIG